MNKKDGKKLAVLSQDIQTTLQKLAKNFEAEEKPSVKNTFKSLWKLQELIQKYFLESDLEIDEFMDLFKAFRESETARSKSYFTSGYIYEEIINKILSIYTDIFDSKDLKMLAEFTDKYGMEYNIYSVLSQITDKINKEQLHAFLNIFKKLQGGGQDSEQSEQQLYVE